MMVGVVGRGRVVSGHASEVERVVRDHAAWLLEGLPELGAMQPGASGPASIQWSEGGRGLRIGDAALARDALSSQGLASGAAEAMLVAGIRSEADAATFRSRQAEQRSNHLNGVMLAIERVRFSDAPMWKEYGNFVAAQPRVRPRHTAALRDGSVVRIAQ
jgi:flavin-dependent dehydrogenase